jgi:O-antigen ligase
LNALHAGLLAASFLIIQLLIGGTRFVFSLPAYALLVISAILSIASLREKSQRPSLVCLLVSAAFFSYILIRAAHSPWDYLWWQDFYKVIACLIVYGLTALYITSASHRMAVMAVMLGLCVLEVFVGLRQFRVGDNWMLFGLIRAENGFRASGTLISPIHFAGLLEALAPFALAFAFWSRWPGWARWLSGYVGILCYIGVAISGSRGAYLSCIFSLFIFSLLCFYAVKKTRPERFLRTLLVTTVVLVAGIAAAVALMSQSPKLRKRLDLVFQQDLHIGKWVQEEVAAPDSPADGSPPRKRAAVDIRVYNWMAALDQYRLAPTFGTGAGTHLYYGRLFRRPQLQVDPIHAHGDYLELIAEYGWVGGAGMGLFILVHLGSGWRRIRVVIREDLTGLTPYEPARHNELALLIGALGAIAAYLAHSVVDFNLHIPGHALLFAFIFGILTSPHRSEKQGSLLLEMPFRLAVPALGIWMALSGLTKFPGEYWCEKARVARRDGRFMEAIALANKALVYEKRNFELYFHLGEAHRGQAMRSVDLPTRRAHLEAAVDAFLNSLDIFDLDEHVLVRLGQAYDALGRYREASWAYRTALDHDPNLGVLHAYYAQHLYRVGRFEEARERFRMAVRLTTQNIRNVVDEAFLDAPTEPLRPENGNPSPTQ